MEMCSNKKDVPSDLLKLKNKQMKHGNEKHQYAELTSQIIGCAMEVHKTLGNGFQALIYQRALALEFNLHGIKFHREVDMNIYYKGEKMGTRRVDFFINNAISIEIKNVFQLEDAHLEEARNYLEASNLGIDLLINFGSKSLDYKLLMSKKIQNHSTSLNQTNQN